jgi:hypothetical protein
MAGSQPTEYNVIPFSANCCVMSIGSNDIVEAIVASENSNVHLALVEYRDHPPQDASFVTRTHDFTSSVSTMKTWLDNCMASGGGDCPG